MSDQPIEVVYEFEMGNRGFVRASISQFRGRQYVDLRLWVEPRDSPGAPLIPTQKGLSVPVEHLQDLAEATDALTIALKPSRTIRTPKRTRVGPVEEQPT